MTKINKKSIKNLVEGLTEMLDECELPEPIQHYLLIAMAAAHVKRTDPASPLSKQLDKSYETIREIVRNTHPNAHEMIVAMAHDEMYKRFKNIHKMIMEKAQETERKQSNEQ